MCETKYEPKIEAKVSDLEGDIKTLYDVVFVTRPIISFCSKTLKIRNQHMPDS